MARFISQLTAASTPLAGTEEVWIEQGGNPRRVDVSELSGSTQGLYRQAWTSVSNDPGTDEWYTVCTISDSGNTPIYFNINAYAHSSVAFIVSKGFSTQTHYITVLHTNVGSVNATFKYIKGIRLVDTGVLQIQLNAGANVDVQALAITCGGALTLSSTLTQATGSEVVRETITLRDHLTRTGTLQADSDGGEISLGERASPDAKGRVVLIEGKANGASGEGSGRVFFTENNASGGANADLYGLSLYYEGDPNAALPSGFQPNTGNATWSLRRHDNSLNGVAIMSGVRTNSNVEFHGNVDLSSTTAQLHIENGTNDVSPTSAASDPLRIGPATGLNLGIDSNEIMARNNGVVSTLSLNIEGGLVNVGSGGLTSSGTIATTGGSSINSNGNVNASGFISAGSYLQARSASGGSGAYLDSTASWTSGILYAPALRWREADSTNIATIRGYVDSSGNNNLSLGTAFTNNEMVIQSNRISLAANVNYALEGTDITDKTTINTDTMVVMGNGAANVLTAIPVGDTRDTSHAPADYNKVWTVEFKTNATAGIDLDGLTDGTYSGVMTFAPWSDTSGGDAYQLGFTEGGLVYRQGDLSSANWNESAKQRWTSVKVGASLSDSRYTSGSDLAVYYPRYCGAVQDASSVANRVGVIHIPRPVSTANQPMLSIIVKGYDYSSETSVPGGGAWAVALGGYPYDATQRWISTSAHTIYGNPPFRVVRFAIDSVVDEHVIVLGDITDDWDYPRFWVDEVMVSFKNTDLSEDGWLDVNDFYCTIDSVIDTNWSFDATESFIEKTVPGTGAFYPGGYIYPQNQASISVSQVPPNEDGYIRNVTGGYGSIQVDGAAGSLGTWRGYSIGGRLVFMDNAGNASLNRGGIYDDQQDDWVIQYNTDGTRGVRLYYQGAQKLDTIAAGVNITGSIQMGTTGRVLSVPTLRGTVNAGGTADNSGVGSYNGYSINNDLIFMHNGSAGGIYDEVNDYWALRTDTNRDYNGLGVTSGFQTVDHLNTLYDVGFNVLPPLNFNTNIDLGTGGAQYVGKCWGKTNTTTYTLTGPSNTELDFPVGGMMQVANLSSTGILTITPSTGCTFSILEGGTLTAFSGSGTINPGSMVTLWRYSASAIYMIGAGVSP